MRTAIFVPFGSLSQEAGVISLVANYMKTTFPEVVQLACNGVFSLCDRDSENNWSRDIHSCARCMADQSRLAGWAALDSLRLSSFLSPEDISESKRWVLSLSAVELMEAEFKGARLFDLCSGTLESRFTSAQIDPKNKNHEQFLRRVMLATLRMCIATRKFNNRFMPELTLVAGSDDFLARSFAAHSKLQGRLAAVFKWEVSTRAVRVMHPRTESSYSCDFVLQDVTSMRAEPKTWPLELLQVVRELMFFLGVPQDQLSLPLAR